MSSQQSTGVVKFFDTAKGFGFIRRQHGDDVFVHVSDVQRSGLTTLFEGQQVDFDIKETPKGPQAENLVAHEFTPRYPPELGPTEAEPVSLAKVFYAAALHVCESEHIDPEECKMWHGKTLAEVDPNFRIDIAADSPSDAEEEHEPSEYEFEVLEKLGQLADLRMASKEVLDFLHEHGAEHEAH